MNLAELLQFIKEYWWLVLGIGGFIAWLISTIIAVLRYYQEGIEYLDRQKNRKFWRWFGGGLGLTVIILLLPEPKVLKSTNKALSVDDGKDEIEV